MKQRGFISRFFEGGSVCVEQIENYLAATDWWADDMFCVHCAENTLFVH